MNRKVLIEGMLVIAFSLITMAEALRLIIYKDPYILYDPFGPGSYVLALGIGMMIVGIVHLLFNFKKLPDFGKVKINREIKMQLLGSVIVLVLYISLLQFIGYVVATLVFCFLEFRVAGISSWRVNLIATMILTGVYYLIFIEFCGMLLPKGILF
jgi:putative tricarboxylic transport membrane protein